VFRFKAYAKLRWNAKTKLEKRIIMLGPVLEVRIQTHSVNSHRVAAESDGMNSCQ